MGFRSEGLLLYRDGDYSKALTVFMSEEIDPAEDTELACYMALCHIRLRENNEAIRMFKQALNHEVQLIRLYQVRMLLAWLLACRDDTSEAIHHCRAIVNDGIQSPQTWSILGYCQWRMGQKNNAIESYTRAVELDDHNANAINGLGYIMADTSRDPETAITLCRKIVERNPNNYAYKDSLGWALFHGGNIPEAEKCLTEALSACPDDAIVAAHLKEVRSYERKKVSH